MDDPENKATTLDHFQFLQTLQKKGMIKETERKITENKTNAENYQNNTNESTSRKNNLPSTMNEKIIRKVEQYVYLEHNIRTDWEMQTAEE